MSKVSSIYHFLTNSFLYRYSSTDQASLTVSVMTVYILDKQSKMEQLEIMVSEHCNWMILNSMIQYSQTVMKPFFTLIMELIVVDILSIVLLFSDNQSCVHTMITLVLQMALICRIVEIV